MALVKQTLDPSCIDDIASCVMSTVSKLSDFNTLSGNTVAVAVGSRGINGIDTVVYNCIKFFKDKGMKPFIVPAMGSHGGATPEGQKAVLAKSGVTESIMGVPVCPEMDVIQLGELSNGVKIYFSKTAWKADHIVVINRIKPHTKFSGTIESGLCKMLTIGLGKIKGATELHRCAVKHTFKIIESAAEHVIKTGKILFGIALLENGSGCLAKIEAVQPSLLIEREKVLLKDAALMMGRIPFDNLDVLIIDLIGKDISGIGMDSNITGRHRDIVGNFYKHPHVKRIFVRDLSPASDGNGNGIGLADITTKRLVDSLDIQKTYVNALAAISPEKAAIPMYFETDHDAVAACIQTAGVSIPGETRIVRIKDTGSLEYFQISKSLEGELEQNPDLKRLTPWKPFEFNENGNLIKLMNF